MYNYCNICNISIYFYNIQMVLLQHSDETSETLETCYCNMPEIRLETLETQHRRAAITYLVGKYGGAGLPFSPSYWQCEVDEGTCADACVLCFPFRDGRGGSVRCWMVCARIPLPCPPSVMAVSAESGEDAVGWGRGGSVTFSSSPGRSSLMRERIMDAIDWEEGMSWRPPAWGKTHVEEECCWIHRGRRGDERTTL